jgi:hypothetical protein
VGVLAGARPRGRPVQGSGPLPAALSVAVPSDGWESTMALRPSCVGGLSLYRLPHPRWHDFPSVAHTDGEQRLTRSAGVRFRSRRRAATRDFPLG